MKLQIKKNENKNRNINESKRKDGEKMSEKFRPVTAITMGAICNRKQGNHGTGG